MGNYAIIGGSSGIGKALALQLIAKNHRVTVICRKNPAIANTDFLYCDVTKDSFPEIADTLDGLAYCPGTITLKPFHQLTVDDFQRDFEINCLGAAKSIKAYLPQLQKGDAASILLFSSVAVGRGMAFHSSIAAAKGAVEGMTRSLAAELSPKVRVNSIAPSLTETPLSAPLMRTKETIEKRHPLKRLGKADDIAAMAAFLLSDESSWITGQVIGVDGGLSTLAVF